jgi:hypothetical protein
MDNGILIGCCDSCIFTVVNPADRSGLVTTLVNPLTSPCQLTVYLSTWVVVSGLKCLLDNVHATLSVDKPGDKLGIDPTLLNICKGTRRAVP